MLKKKLLPICIATVLSLVACNSNSTSGDTADSGRATCKIEKDSNSIFRMTVVVPDSGTATTELAKTNGNLKLSMKTTVDNASLSNEETPFCTAILEDVEEDEEISCSGNTYTISTFLGEDAFDYFSVIVSEYKKECRKIQETGIANFNDEDDEEFEDDEEYF